MFGDFNAAVVTSGRASTLGQVAVPLAARVVLLDSRVLSDLFGEFRGAKELKRSYWLSERDDPGHETVLIWSMA